MQPTPRHRRTGLSGLLALALLGALSPAAVAAPAPSLTPSATTAKPAATTELILSEYVEGSATNKAVEIYNGTGASVDLSTYKLNYYSNGATTATSIQLTGTLADGDVFVLASATAAPAILAVADQTTTQGLWNGDDAIALYNGATLVDSFGQRGVDPGTKWGTPPTSTENNTLRRKATVCAGDLVPDDAFDPATEWDGFAIDTFDGLGSHTADCGPTAPVDPVINEFSANTVGTTDVEYLEVFGAKSTDYSDLTIVQVEGDSSSTSVGKIVTADPVGSTDADGYWLGNLANGRLQNGTLTLLLVSGYTDQSVIDADKDGVIDDGTGLTVLDAVAVSDGDAGDLTYGVTLAKDFDGGTNAVGGASRIPNGTDTDAAGDWVRNDFDLAGMPGIDGTPVVGEAYNTPGAVNEAVEEEEPPVGGECGDPALAIGAVQGAGAESPKKGQNVTVEGTVVGDFQTGGFNGYFVQDAGDGNPATSDGIFVYAPSGADVAVGDKVRVTGGVVEFNGMTQLNLGTLSVCATGQELPPATPVTLPISDYEPYEGMSVTFTQTLSILEYFNYARYGEVVLGMGDDTARQYQPTALADPASPEAVAIKAWNASHRITLDDGLTAQNPDYLRHPAGGQFTLTHSFRGGDTIDDLTGVLAYQFNAWKVQPTTDAEYTAANPRPAVPAVGGTTQIASFNVLNYFTTLTSEDPNARGADTPEEFDRQESKIVSALAALDGDVVGLIEIENNGDEAVATLVQALNDKVGAGTYAYIPTGKIGTDAITTALIYKPAAVTPVGDFAVLDSSVDPRFLDDFNRPALAQTFQDKATGGMVTVTINHLKSKGSSCAAAGDPEDPWAGNCNGIRTDAAEALGDWLNDDPTGTGASNVLVLGDLNSYDHEDPIVALEDRGFTDMEKQFGGEDAYSYVFDGQLGYLDYALSNAALQPRITGAEAWHINSDEPSVLDYDMSFKGPGQDALFAPDPFRSSDHDPVLVGMNLAKDEPEPVVERIAGQDRYDTAAEIALRFGSADVVYLANGRDYPDALAGTPAAVLDDAPILLTGSGALPQATVDALSELSPASVIVLGGTTSVSEAAAQQAALASGGTVTRLAGENRYGTAVEVAKTFDPASIDTVYIASGQVYADALAAGPLAGVDGDPVLLTRGTSLPKETKAALADLDPDTIVVLGGEASVSQAVADELVAYGTVERVAGENRYETAALLAEEFGPTDEAYVASGTQFADALAGGAYAGHQDAPLLLTDPLTLSEPTADDLVTRDPSYVGIFGGINSVSEAVRLEIVALLAS